MIRIFMNGYSNNKGGVETYISNLCSHLDPSQFEVFYNMPEMIIDGKKWIRPKNRHNYLKYRLFWEKFYRENHFDVLYDNECDIVSIDQLKFARRAGVKVRVLHSHNTGIQQNVGSIHRILEIINRYTLRRYVTVFLACSQVAGDWMFDGRIFDVIHNGIDLKQFTFNRSWENEKKLYYSINKHMTIGCIGRMENQKNVFFAIDVFKKCLEHNSDLVLLIIGEGSLRNDLENYVANIHLEKNIFFTGSVDDVYKYYSCLDCLLMPSLFEGLPFVLVEAQAAGLHCVVSSNVSQEANITGLVDYVDLDAGLDVWSEKVLNACSQPRQDVSQKLIEAGYSIENTAKQVSNIIIQELEKQKRRDS